MPLSKVTLNLQTFGMSGGYYHGNEVGLSILCCKKYPFAHNWHEGYN